MKRLFIIIAVAALLTLTSGIALADTSGPLGPAPYAGDGVSDGSGLDAPNGPIGDVGSGTGPVGPAPDSGDGVPDGSGL